MIAEKEITIQEALDWLQAEMEVRGIAGTVCRDQAELRRGVYTFIGVPVRIDDETLGAYDRAKLLTELANNWNDREPRPEKLLALVPAGVPDGAW